MHRRYDEKRYTDDEKSKITQDAHYFGTDYARRVNDTHADPFKFESYAARELSVSGNGKYTPLNHTGNIIDQLLEAVHRVKKELEQVRAHNRMLLSQLQDYEVRDRAEQNRNLAKITEEMEEIVK